MQGAEKYDRSIDPHGESSVAQVLRWVRPGSSVLEMGPATGVMTKLLQSEKQCDIVCVEIDSKVAAEASRYCRKMVVADLNQLDWELVIAEERFDYITFADVLEHLPNPLSVLRRALNFLKPEGEVLISVPNVGYVGIIAELLVGQFDYRLDGLLDETHLHFFTRKSLKELIDQAGLISVEWSRTIIAPEFSEFRLQTKRLGAATRGVLSAVPDGDTYQFLARCKKSGVAAFPEVQLPAFRACVGFSAQVYYDRGGGFNETDSVVLPLVDTAKQQTIRCDLPAGVKAIRFDPIDARVPVALSAISVRHDENMLFEWRSEDGPVTKVSRLLNLREVHAANLSVLIPLSDGPQITISVECSEEPVLEVVLALNGADLMVDIVGVLRSDLLSRDKEILLRDTEIENLRFDLRDVGLQLSRSQSDFESQGIALASSENSKRVAHESLDLLVKSTSWRLTRPFRVGKRLIKAVPKYVLHKLGGRIKGIIKDSKRLLASRVGAYLWRSLDIGTDYELRVLRLNPTANELSKVRKASLVGHGPKFSIIMPTYKTKPKWLKEAIESVIHQAYPLWELCVADDASDDPAIRSLLTTYSANDPRVKVAFLRENGHISRASNAALELATGEFVVLLDHDDLLAAQALYRLAEVIKLNPNADVLYSDEDKVSQNGTRFEPTCKPAWSPEYFLSFMYTGHISCFRSTLIRSVGGFREGFEGSQDYDLMLRVTERSSRVVHIPEILYHWRAHDDSVAANLNSKPYAFVAAKKALKEALHRRGFLSGAVVDSRSKGLYVTRRNQKTGLQAVFAIGTHSVGSDLIEAESVVVAADDIPGIRPAVKAHKLDDSSVVAILFGASLTKDDCDILLDYFCDPGVGVVAPLIVSSDAVVAAGAAYVQGALKPNLAGAKLDQPGYRGRLVVPSNVSFVYPICFLVRVELIRDVPTTISSPGELAIAVCLEAMRRNRRCVIDPSVRVVQAARVDTLDVSAQRLSSLKAYYGMSEFVDPFLPLGLSVYCGQSEMPIV